MFIYPKKYDVIVIGAGTLVSRLPCCGTDGASKHCSTINAELLGKCPATQPSAGLAKGHLAREIDALGGEWEGTDMAGSSSGC